MKKILQKYLRLLHHHDRGIVAITFILSLPILLLILGIITQFALIINARIVLDRAVSAAARSAMVALPTDPTVDTLADGTSLDGVSFVNKSARMVLETISPRTKNGSSEEAQDVTQALQSAGLPIPDAYADHYTFAQDSTTVSWQRLDDSGQPIAEADWQPADFAAAPGQRIQLTVQYNFLLTVPFPFPDLLNKIVGHSDTISGVQGDYITMTSVYTVQLSPGREAATDANGYPLNPTDH